MLFRSVLLAVLVDACIFTPGVEYVCIPCGGLYICHATGSCVQNTLSDCTLPATATYWECCEEDTCDSRGSDMCSYVEPVDNGYEGPAPWKIILGILVIILFCTLILGVIAVVIGILTKKKAPAKLPYSQTSTYGSQTFSE